MSRHFRTKIFTIIYTCFRISARFSYLFFLSQYLLSSFEIVTLLLYIKNRTAAWPNRRHGVRGCSALFLIFLLYYFNIFFFFFVRLFGYRRDPSRFNIVSITRPVGSILLCVGRARCGRIVHSGTYAYYNKRETTSAV